MEIDNFFNRIDVLLTQRHWSRKRLADETGIKNSTLQGYWTQKRYPRGDDLVRIAESLETSAEYLITGRGQPTVEDNPILEQLYQFLRRFSDEELIELRGVIRSHVMTYFRNPPPDSSQFAADKKRKKL